MQQAVSFIHGAPFDKIICFWTLQLLNELYQIVYCRIDHLQLMEHYQLHTTVMQSSKMSCLSDLKKFYCRM